MCATFHVWRILHAFSLINQKISSMYHEQPFLLHKSSSINHNRRRSPRIQFFVFYSRNVASPLNSIPRSVFPDVTVAPFLFVAGTDSKHYTTVSDSIFRFMPIRMTPNDITLPHNANERIGLHAFKCVHTGATLPHARHCLANF